MALYEHSGLASQIPIPVAQGGTGSSTAATAINALLPDQTSNSGKVLTTNGTVVSWGAAGSSEVTGPGSSTDNAVARFDLTTGKVIQNSVVIVGDGGDVTGVAALSVSGIFTAGGGQVGGGRVVTAAGAITVATTDYYVVVKKTVGAATTVNLPATPTAWTTYVIKDGKLDAGTNNITITPAAGNIEGAATYVMNVNGQAAKIFYSGTEWFLA